jgi:hypothetical protein
VLHRAAYLAHDSDCQDADAEILGWPCYRDGFDVPNPSASEGHPIIPIGFLLLVRYFRIRIETFFYRKVILIRSQNSNQLQF